MEIANIELSLLSDALFVFVFGLLGVVAYYVLKTNNYWRNKSFSLNTFWHKEKMNLINTGLLLGVCSIVFVFYPSLFEIVEFINLEEHSKIKKFINTPPVLGGCIAAFLRNTNKSVSVKQES